MPKLRNKKDLFFEDVEEKIGELKKRMNKEQGNLDRHTLKIEGRIESYRTELVMLGALLEHLPQRAPDFIEPIKDEENAGALEPSTENVG